MNTLFLFSLIVAIHLTYLIHVDPPHTYGGKCVILVAWLLSVIGVAIGVNL